MKRNKILKSILLIIALLTLWNACNYKAKEKSDLEFPLPLNLRAVYYGSDVQYPILGLVIQDDLNFVLVGKYDYFLVDGDSMEVEKITKLGIGNNKLLVEVLNTKGYTFYIECTKNKDITVNSGVTLITHEKIDMLNQESINWIGADEILDILK